MRMLCAFIVVVDTLVFEVVTRILAEQCKSCGIEIKLKHVTHKASKVEMKRRKISKMFLMFFCLPTTID